MKRSIIIKLTLVSLVLGISGWLLYSKWEKISDTNRKVERISTVTKMDIIQRVTIAGNIVPERKTIVTAPFNGYIKKLYVKIGQIVKKGAPIVSVVQSLQSVDPVFPLRAPFSGTVVTVRKYEGEFVKQDDPKDFILRIDSLENFYIVSNVPEIDMVKIKSGQKAIIKVSAILGKKYNGIVDEISLASKNQEEWRGNSKVEFPAKIKITNQDQDIRSGMSAILDIVTFKKENVLALAHEFILKESDKYFVLLAKGGRKEIKIGIQNEALFEILNGVTEGEKVRQVDFMELLTKSNR